MRLDEDFAKIGALAQRRVRMAAPVVEIAGDQQRLAVGNVLPDEVTQLLELACAVGLLQPEVHTDGVHDVGTARQAQRAMQQSALFLGGDVDVDVLRTHDRILRQQRIAVVAVRAHGIAPVALALTPPVELLV